MEYACCHVWKSCDISHSCTASRRQIFIFHAFVWFPASRRHSISSAHNRRMPRPAFRYAGKYTDPIYTNSPSHVHTSGNGWFFFLCAGRPLFGYVPRMRIHMQLSKSSPAPRRRFDLPSSCETAPSHPTTNHSLVSYSSPS